MAHKFWITMHKIGSHRCETKRKGWNARRGLVRQATKEITNRQNQGATGSCTRINIHACVSNNPTSK